MILGTFSEGEKFELGGEVEGFFEVIYSDGGYSLCPCGVCKRSPMGTAKQRPRKKLRRRKGQDSMQPGQPGFLP